ncbi:MAG: hypothetical protein HYZ75_14630 [Elusimicrobia bacterium]|nr:hypothetical protein [Elusimicrobiota bacterium]
MKIGKSKGVRLAALTAALLGTLGAMSSSAGAPPQALFVESGPGLGGCYKVFTASRWAGAITKAKVTEGVQQITLPAAAYAWRGGVAKFSGKVKLLEKCSSSKVIKESQYLKGYTLGAGNVLTLQ